MKTLDELLPDAVAMHGHVCPGQVLGVRMAMVGCREVEIDEPKESRNLMVWVEIDRCAADAVQSVTGRSLGRRTLKYVDYGKVAATFLNTETRKAVRVVVRDDARAKARGSSPPEAEHKEAQLSAYGSMPEADLFLVQPVAVMVPEEDQPGHPLRRVACHQCGEGINDKREVQVDGRTLCRACAHGAYYILHEADPAGSEPPP